jgi:hypothetical protein
MINYGAKIRDVKGTVIDATNVPLPKACIAAFNADHSKLLRTIETDVEGKYIVDRMPAGRYSRVVKDQQRLFCPKAARLKVGRWRGKRDIAVHMDVRGIDRSSFFEAR